MYPREVVKVALQLNAGAVIPCHNHPSGVAEASAADRASTDSLKTPLQLVDVRVLDHLIVSSMTTLSFAEQGPL
jgi:DNA repair protein RadC